MHWRLSEASAIGVVGPNQIEVVPGSPTKGVHWQLNGSQAALGVSAWQIAAVRALPAHSSQPQEVYSRQSDLIVRYGQGPGEQFSYQLDWRLLEPAAPFVAAIELWLSVQTSLLDTQPEIEIACVAPAGERWSTFSHQQLMASCGASTETVQDADRPAATTIDRSAAVEPLRDAARGPAALLGSSNNHAAHVGGQDAAQVAAQCLWLIEPSDQCHARRCTEDDQAEQRVRLFGHFMEKGVIRRARMRLLMGVTSDSQAGITLPQVMEAYRDFADSPLPLTA